MNFICKIYCFYFGNVNKFDNNVCFLLGGGFIEYYILDLLGEVIK